MCQLSPCAPIASHPVVDIILKHTSECYAIVFSDVDVKTLVVALHQHHVGVMNFRFWPEPADEPEVHPPDTNYYSEALRVPCLVHVFWGNLSLMMVDTLRAVERQKAVVIRSEYYLLYDTAGGDPAALFQSLHDRPHVAVLSRTPAAARSRAGAGDVAGGGAGDDMRVHGRCLYCDSGAATVYEAGNWSQRHGLLLPLPLFFDQFADFNGHRLRCVTLKFVPFVSFDVLGGGLVVPRSSIDVNALNIMASKWNFTYVMRKPADSQWGVQLDNGTWNGVVGELVDNEADFSLVLTMNFARSGVIRFIRIYAIQPFVFVTRLAQPLPQWLSIFRPFKMSLWLIAIGSVVVSGLLAFFFTRLHPHPERHFTFGVSLFNSYGAMCENAQSRLPVNSMSAQMFLGWWWLYCIIILTAYKSTLVAMMTVPSLSGNINSLEELVASGLSWGLGNSKGSDYTLFKESPIPLYQRMFASMQYQSTVDSFHKLMSEPYAFISWRSNLQTVIADNYSDHRGQPLVHISHKSFSPENFAWGFRPSAPFVHKFDTVMQWLTEAGLIRKWELDTMEESAALARRRRKRHTADNNSHFLSLSLYHMQGAFIVLAAGYGASVLTLLLEALVHRCSRRQGAVNVSGPPAKTSE